MLNRFIYIVFIIGIIFGCGCADSVNMAPTMPMDNEYMVIEETSAQDAEYEVINQSTSLLSEEDKEKLFMDYLQTKALQFISDAEKIEVQELKLEKVNGTGKAVITIVGVSDKDNSRLEENIRKALCELMDVETLEMEIVWI